MKKVFRPAAWVLAVIGVAVWAISLTAPLYSLLLDRAHYDHLAWSPDGQTITFRRVGGKDDYYRIDAERGKLGRVTVQSPAASPQVSFDGTMQVVQDEQDNLWLMNADGSEKRLLVQTGSQNIPFHYQFAWSPDSRWLAFQAEPSDHVEQIKIIQPRLYTGSAAAQVTYRDLNANYLSFFKWSSDSRSLALIAKYVCCDDATQGQAYHSLFTLSVESADPPQQVFRTHHGWEFIDDFAWSPDDQRIAVSTSFSTNSYYDAPRLYIAQVSDRRDQLVHGRLSPLGKYARKLLIANDDGRLLSYVALGAYLAPLLTIPLLRRYGRRTRYLKIALVVYYVLLILFCILALLWLISVGDKLA